MTDQTRRGPGPDSPTPPTADDESTATHSTAPVKEAVDYGAVLDCVTNCTGRPDCAWRPYTCRILTGGER